MSKSRKKFLATTYQDFFSALYYNKRKEAGAAVIHVWVWATRPRTQTTPLHRLAWTAHHSIMFLNSDLILSKHFVKRVVSAPLHMQVALSRYDAFPDTEVSKFVN